MLNFFFARPQHFDRLAGHGLGNHDCLAGKVLRTFSTQTTPQLHGVNFHIGLRYTGSCCANGQCRLWILSGRPNFKFVTLQPSCAHHRLHGGMRQVRRKVFSLYHFGRFRQCVCCIAIVARHSQFILLHASLEVSHDGRASQGTVLAHIPIDSNFTQGFFGTPPVVSNHSHKFAHV